MYVGTRRTGRRQGYFLRHRQVTISTSQATPQGTNLEVVTTYELGDPLRVYHAELMRSDWNSQRSKGKTQIAA